MHQIVALAVGRDPALLETRTLVLQSDGYKVISAYSVRQALEQLEAVEPDVVILCHSLPAQHRERLTDAVRGRSSKTRVVVIGAEFGSDAKFVDAVLNTEPRHMLRELAGILGKPVLPMRTGKQPAN
jgi:DNA-binding response OmpR family regulator